jgi:lambda family phage tail tape measure protein
MSSSVIGQGVIELVADARKLKAGIEDAKKSIRTLGDGQKDINAAASQSIDKYIGKLNQQNALYGKTTRETELYKLALRGASNEQIKSADAALTLSAAHEQNARSIATLKTGFIAAAAAGTLVAGALIMSIKSAIDAADHLNDLSKKTGIAADTLGGLGFAASQAGGDLESVSAAAGKLNKSIAEAAGGNKEFGVAFKALGINIRDASGQLKTADVVMSEIATKFAGFEDGPEKAALALRLFGKTGADIIPLLNDGGKALQENVEYYKKYSGVTKEVAEQSDQFNDTLGKLHLLSGAFGQQLAAQVLPAMQGMADELLQMKESGTGLALLIRDLAGEINGVARELITGRKEATSFWDAIWTFGTINPFADLGTNIKSYREDIESMTAAIERYKRAGSDTSSLEQSIKTVQKKLKFVTAQQAGEAVADSRGDYSNEGRIPSIAEAATPKKKPRAPVLPGSGTGAAAAAEAKAQLAFDLAQIKKASEANTDAFSNAEKIMEARRAADLIDERQYYAAKLGFLNLNSAEQERELQKEIARRQASKLEGKDRIDNERKIVELQGQLSKVRADAVANVEVLATQEVAANKKIAQSYVDATIAAQAYLNTINKQNQREIDGIGKGVKFRDNQAGRNAIEDKQTTQVQALESDKRNHRIDDKQFDNYMAVVNETYAAEIDAYDKRTAALNAKQSDWINGATEALQNYYDESKNIAKQFEDAFTNAFKGLEDALVKFTETGKLDAKSLLSSIASDVNRSAIKQYVTGPLAKLTNDAIGGGKSSPAIDPLTGQTLSINASTTALDLLAAAARNAAAAIGTPAASSTTPSIATTGDFARYDRAQIDPASIATTGDFARYDRGQTGEQSISALFSDTAKTSKDAQEAVDGLGKSTTSAASDLAKLAAAAGQGGGALSLLPSIVNLFQAAVASSSASSSGGGLGGLFGSLFSSGASSSASSSVASDAITSYYFHTGGIVNNSGSSISASPSMFSGATRYHTGGIAGKAADQLKANEIPAILMGGPKGTREEVLHASDPRHRDNIDPKMLAQITSGDTSNMRGGDQYSSLMRSIANTINEGDTHTTLTNLMQRIGVDHPRIAPNLAQSIAAMDAMPVRGARELGGPVSAGGLYRVNEKGPELLQVAGKQYLMMGSQAGHVDVNTGNQGKGGDTVLHVNVTPPAGSSPASAAQWGSAAGRQIQHHLRRNS